MQPGSAGRAVVGARAGERPLWRECLLSPGLACGEGVEVEIPGQGSERVHRQAAIWRERYLEVVQRSRRRSGEVHSIPVESAAVAWAAEPPLHKCDGASKMRANS